jgi:hypothetical protein
MGYLRIQKVRYWCHFHMPLIFKALKTNIGNFFVYFKKSIEILLDRKKFIDQLRAFQSSCWHDVHGWPCS